MILTSIGRVRTFLFVSGVLIAVAVVVTGLVVGKLFEKLVLDHETSRSAEATLSEARQELAPAAFEALRDNANVVRFERVVEALPGVFRLKAFDSKGRIVWSNEQRLIGSIFPDDLDLARARGGEIVTSIGRPTKSEHLYERTIPWIAEVYVPITFHGSARVVGVIETYRNVTPVVESIRRTQQIIWAVVGVTGLVLWSALGLVARQASINERRVMQRLETQNREVTLLQRVTRALLRPLDPRQVAETVVASAVTGLGMSRAAIYRVDTDAEPVLLANWPVGSPPPPPWRFGENCDSAQHGVRVALPMLTHEGMKHVFMGDFGDAIASERAAMRGLEIMVDEASVALANADLFSEISDAHQRLSAILAGIADRMLIVDRQMQVVWMNAASAAACGIGDDVVGQSCFSTFGMEAAACEDCPAARTFHSGHVERGTRTLHLPHGEIRHLDLVTAPLRNASGEIYQVLEVARDITDLVQMEERLKEANQALLDAQAQLIVKERLAAIGQLVVTLHHEILNPLTSILGALQVFKGAKISEGTSKEAVAAIEIEARRIERLVRDLGELRRSEGVPYVGQTTMLDTEHAGRVAASES